FRVPGIAHRAAEERLSRDVEGELGGSSAADGHKTRLAELSHQVTVSGCNEAGRETAPHILPPTLGRDDEILDGKRHAGERTVSGLAVHGIVKYFYHGVDGRIDLGGCRDGGFGELHRRDLARRH